MGEQDINKYKTAIKQRMTAVRMRTWALTIAIAIALVFYFLMQTFIKESINVVDFFFLCITAILVHFIYFPDGEIFGQKDKQFITNRDAYNDKATKINEQHTFKYLKEYCEVEYQERKKRYITEELSLIGITEEEYKWFKQKDIKFIQQKDKFEIEIDHEHSKFIVLARGKKKKLIKLLFEPIPIEKNEPDTIMSAIEVRTSRKITDKSRLFKMSSNISKVLLSFVMGAVFAYTGYILKDGIGIEQITLIIMFLTTIFSTAVTSFSSGEICQRVYRKQFYIELSLFIDGFNEWLYNKQVKPIDKQQN